jgi:transcriptional regulator with XRE-family HTH domain
LEILTHLRINARKIFAFMENFDEKAIIERIRYLRKQHSGGRGRSKFARTLGISASTYNYYENNRVPPFEILLKISDVTGADLNWLLTGRKTLKTPILEPGKFAFGPNSSLLRKLDNLLSENPELAEPISAFIELLCEKKGVEKEFYSDATLRSTRMPPAKPARPGWIPVLGRTAAGIVHFWDKEVLPQPKQAVTELDELVKKHIGKSIIASTDGTVSIDLQARALVDGLKRRQANLIQVSGQEQDGIVEFVQCEEVFELFPDSFALHIDGDSMSPRINDGDIVILSPSVPAAQGQIGVARLANQIGVTCKLIRSTEEAVHLIPINEKYETKVIVKKDLLWALAVLCHIST